MHATYVESDYVETAMRVIGKGARNENQWKATKKGSAQQVFTYKSAQLVYKRKSAPFFKYKSVQQVSKEGSAL